jgi:hypothetical protein
MKSIALKIGIHWYCIYASAAGSASTSEQHCSAPQNRQRSNDAKPDSFTFNPNKVMQQDLHVQNFLHL